MSLHRFFVAGSVAGGEVRVTGQDLHHLRDVLRLEPGAEIAIADAEGRQGVARLLDVAPDAATAEVVRVLPDVFLPDVTLVQGLSRGPKMDLVVQKATEIGVTRILPVVMKRSVVRVDDRASAGKAERWRRIAAEAAKQSQRATVPAVESPIPFDELPGALACFDVVLVPWEEADGLGIAAVLASAGATPDSRVAVVVGPEGGIEPAEVERLVAAGAVPVTLGPTILRTETAAIVAVALASQALGGLGGAAR